MLERSLEVPIKDEVVQNNDDEERSVESDPFEEQVEVNLFEDA